MFLRIWFHKKYKHGDQSYPLKWGDRDTPRYYKLFTMISHPKKCLEENRNFL